MPPASVLIPATRSPFKWIRLSTTTTFHKGDEYILDCISSNKPMTEAELHYHMKMIYPEANDFDMHTYIAGPDQQVDKVMERSGILVIGEKPTPGEKNYYALADPNSNYIIRIWDGGMESYAQFCLDFFDTNHNSAVDLPEGNGLH